jgi:prepilin-type N-terminal cleavage/methylation domain-containing protein/prepilin-type processing-associated H-X9-DG protein
MKTFIDFPVHPENTRRTSLAGGCPDHGFTLLELLVVLGAVAMLALVLVPALAGTKIDTWRLQCQNNLKQLQVGFQLFARDHNDMFPPAGDQGSSGRQLAWDAYLHHYFGDTNSDASWSLGIMLASPSPAAGVGIASTTMEKIEVCPADRFPKVTWLTGPPAAALRSYAVNSVGPNWGTQYGVSTQNGTYPLPDLNQPGYHGVGIWWTSTGLMPDWDAKGYKSSVVKDPGGTILLCEETGGQQCMGNTWTCVCNGPQTSQNGSPNGNLYQIDTTSIPQNPAGSAGVNQGELLYNSQGGRFNYAFHDGHVAALKIEQTVGTGTLNAPKGMWTVTPGD